MTAIRDYDFAGSDAKIIEGLDFTNKSRRLRQIYRSPAPVYIASLALMFRWFADEGPKVLPTVTDLETNFGFESVLSSNGDYTLMIKSDAHPANSWCHTVATFPTARAAFSALLRERVGRRELLWVRFCEEDLGFDYELLANNFTYHNCFIQDAHKISDKYVKGQDFPVVVIEGFPDFMDPHLADSSDEAQEEKMWAFRRELYLCASRATCFLYFICNVADTPEIGRIKTELRRLIDAVAVPSNMDSGGVRKWRFVVTNTSERRKLDVFSDAINVAEGEIVPVAEAIAASSSAPVAKSTDHLSAGELAILGSTTAAVEADRNHLEAVGPRESMKKEHSLRSNKSSPGRIGSAGKLFRLSPPYIVKDVAAELGLKPHQIIRDLMMDYNIFVNVNGSISADILAQICTHYGFVLLDPTLPQSDATQPKRDTDQRSEVKSVARDAKPLVATPPTVDVLPKRIAVDLISPKAESSSVALTILPKPKRFLSEETFPHKLTVSGPMSVMQFARELGVQHRELINHLARRRVYATGSYMLNVAMMRSVAHAYRFGLIVSEGV